jgi:hypothetical protein
LAARARCCCLRRARFWRRVAASRAFWSYWARRPLSDRFGPASSDEPRPSFERSCDMERCCDAGRSRSSGLSARPTREGPPPNPVTQCSRASIPQAGAPPLGPFIDDTREESSLAGVAMRFDQPTEPRPQPGHVASPRIATLPAQVLIAPRRDRAMAGTWQFDDSAGNWAGANICPGSSSLLRFVGRACVPQPSSRQTAPSCLVGDIRERACRPVPDSSD